MVSVHSSNDVDPEKYGHGQHLEKYNTFETTVGGTNFVTDEDNLPPGYFTSAFFLGTMTAIGLGLFAGVAGFGYAAPVLGVINADIGPVCTFMKGSRRARLTQPYDANIVWVALVYTLTIAVTLTIIGRVSDIFGRRWVFIGGAACGVIGSIVCATAHSVNHLIGGETIISIGAATQLSYYYVMGELVPMKYRLAGNAFCYVFTIPGSGIAPAVAQAFIQYHPATGWRGGYYVLIGVNALSLLCWVLFYHPPTFEMKHPGKKAVYYAKHFDYAGTVLYAGGLFVLLLGLNWGGSVHPWASAYVICTIVIGFVALVAFVLWESFMKLKEPLVPMHLFRNRAWNAATIVSGLGASIYYAFAIVWPSMVAILYSDGNPMNGAWLASLVGLLIVIGEIVGGFCAKAIGHVKWQLIITILLGGIFFGCVATCTPDTKARAAALVSLGVFFIGWTESLAITAVTLTAKNQNELGTASGVAGSVRFLISSISATVYTVILTSRLAETIPSMVPPRLIAAGLPASSITAFIGGFTTGNFTGIPGASPEVIAIGTRAYQDANAAAYRTVFLTTIAFTGVAVIASFCLPDLDHLLTGKVSTTLGKENQKKVIQTEKS